MEWLEEHKSTNLKLWDVLDQCIESPDFKKTNRLFKNFYVVSLYRNTKNDSIYMLKMRRKYYNDIVFLYENGIPVLQSGNIADDFIMIESLDRVFL